MEMMKWYDSRSKAARMFISEYGDAEFLAWRRSKQPMRNYEIELRRRMRLLPDGLSPIWDEYGKERYQ